MADDQGQTMRIFYGCSGAILGAFAGAIIALAGMAAADVDGIGSVVLLAFFGPLGILAGGCVGTLGALRIFDFLRRDAAIHPDWTLGKVFLVACLYLGYPGMAIGALQCAFYWHTTPPSDSTLIADFHRHESIYTQIVQMQEADRYVTQLSMSWTTPDNPPLAGIPFSRIDEYRSLLTKINVPDGFDVGPDGGTEFMNWGIGDATTSNTSKGVIYLTTPHLPIFASLDDCRRGGNQRITAYRHIEGDWYLIYDYVPE